MAMARSKNCIAHVISQGHKEPFRYEYMCEAAISTVHVLHTCDKKLAYWLKLLYVYIYVYIYVCIYICIHICIYIYVCIYMYTYMYIYIYVYVYMYKYMYIIVYIYNFIYVFIYLLCFFSPSFLFPGDL